MGNSLIFDGINSADYGVILSGGGTYATPERDVTVVSVPGRNGDVILDNGRYNNIQIVYTAGISKGFETKFLPFIGALKAVKGYARLVDSYHPEEFRLASFRSELVPEVGTIMRSGKFELVFDCMPQRFLKSGEQEIELNFTTDPISIGGTDWDSYSDLDASAKSQVDELGLSVINEYPKFTLPRDTDYVVMRSPNENYWIYPNDALINGGYRTDSAGCDAGDTYHAASASSPFLSVWDDTAEIYSPSYFATHIYNPTEYAAAPLIKIYYDPDVAPGLWDLDTAFGIDGDNYVRYNSFTDTGTVIWASNEVYIDCDSFEAYSDSAAGIGRVSHNSGVIFGPGLLIPPGESVFRVSNFRASFTNVLKIALIPRWWRL